jgi:hypothetical protein
MRGLRLGFRRRPPAPRLAAKIARGFAYFTKDVGGTLTISADLHLQTKKITGYFLGSVIPTATAASRKLRWTRKRADHEHYAAFQLRAARKDYQQWLLRGY